jgi:hypothetical protein
MTENEIGGGVIAAAMLGYLLNFNVAHMRDGRHENGERAMTYGVHCAPSASSALKSYLKA